MPIVHEQTEDPITAVIAALPTPQLAELATVHRDQASALLHRKYEVSQAASQETARLERDHEWHMFVVQLLRTESARRSGAGR